LRFGRFELDIDARKLVSPDGRVRLQEQPFVILRLLVEQRGRVVTRDELRRRLWPEGTFVDFEHSLNAAIKRLRAVLGDDADNPKYVETIPRRGYRFLADADEDSAIAEASEFRLRLAVLPFAAFPAEGADDYFGDGFTEEMISEMGRRARGRLAVISSHSSRAFRHSPLSARAIGAALRADYLLEGSIRQNAKRVRITARLVATSTETQLWVETYEQPLNDWLEVQAAIAARIARSLELELLPADAPAYPASVSEGARQALRKGRYHYQRPADSGAADALRFFEEAIEIAPSFSAAHAGIAMVEVMRAVYYHDVPRCALTRAHDAARRALECDAPVAEAHLTDGDVKRLLHWDPRGARIAYTKAISMNPTLESARTSHARLLVSLGRFTQAIREADVGRELDPRCLTANSLAAWARYAAGDYDEAADLSRHTLEMDETHVGARQILGAALLAADSPREALRVLEWGADSAGVNPLALASLAHARAMTGDRSAALHLLERLDAVGRHRYVSPYHLALVHAALQDGDAALAMLSRACADRDPAVTNVAIDPRLTSLRQDSRLHALVRQLGLQDFHRR